MNAFQKDRRHRYSTSWAGESLRCARSTDGWPSRTHRDIVKTKGARPKSPLHPADLTLILSRGGTIKGPIQLSLQIVRIDERPEGNPCGQEPNSQDQPPDGDPAQKGLPAGSRRLGGRLLRTVHGS